MVDYLFVSGVATSMVATCDDTNMKVYFDGVQQTPVPASEANSWNTASTIDIPSGTSVVGIECENGGGTGGILASFDNGVVTDGTWQCSTQSLEAVTGMADAVAFGANGNGIPAIDSAAQWIWTSDNKYSGGQTKVFCVTAIQSGELF